MSETRSVNRDSFLSMHVFVVIKRRRASCKGRVVGCRCYTLRALALTHTQPPPVHRGQCPGTGSVSCPHNNSNCLSSDATRRLIAPTSFFCCSLFSVGRERAFALF